MPKHALIALLLCILLNVVMAQPPTVDVICTIHNKKHNTTNIVHNGLSNKIYNILVNDYNIKLNNQQNTIIITLKMAPKRAPGGFKKEKQANLSISVLILTSIIFMLLCC